MRPYLTLHDPEQARAWYRDGLWTDDTPWSLLTRHASERPQAVALRDGRSRLTWTQLLERTETLAGVLERRGLVTGDRVSVWMSDRVEPVLALLACSRNGYTLNPSLHRTHTCAEVAALLRLIGTRVLITEPGWGADNSKGTLEEVATHLPDGLFIDTPGSLPVKGPGPEKSPADNADRISYLAFTSGTTGPPKCVMHSANTLFSNARDMVRFWKLDTGTRILTLSPLSHHIAWVAVAEWLTCGGQLIVNDPPSGLGQLGWIVETGATCVMGVPTHAMDILQEQREAELPRLGSVTMFYMAGAPIPPVVCEALIAQDIRPQNVYGMTENSSHHFTHPGDDPDTWINSCGRGGPAYEVMIVDAEDPDRPAAPGATGQIAGRGAALMLGYYGEQDATARSFNKDGWFLSGDLGYLDQNGNLHVSGRLKDLIIRGGHNIYPAHIEALALRSPHITRAAVFPIPDERLGERACIAIVGDLDGSRTLEHLAAEGLSRYDMPEYFLSLPSFPLTASGKVLKRELMNMLALNEISPVAVRYQPGKEADEH